MTTETKSEVTQAWLEKDPSLNESILLHFLSKSEDNLKELGIFFFHSFSEERYRFTYFILFKLGLFNI